MRKPVIFDADGRVVRHVKNLGWLLRNWQSVEEFLVEEERDFPYYGKKSAGAMLGAMLKDGGSYVTPFADRAVLAHFLTRPVFLGLPVRWLGHPMHIGDAGWKQFLKTQAW